NALRPGVIGLMRSITPELGPTGVRVNAICPGYIYTSRVEELMSNNESAKDAIESRIPLGRMGTPSEFGATCAFLLSPVASYIHGALLLIDGGLYQGMM
ncbi:SDR family oxidoreductase, partial [Candidatus Thorarchaeota archaeon]